MQRSDKIGLSDRHVAILGIFVDLFCYFYFVSVVLSCLFFAALRSTAGKGWPLGSLVCDVCLYFCHLPMLCPGSGVVLDLSILILIAFFLLLIF